MVIPETRDAVLARAKVARSQIARRDAAAALAVWQAADPFDLDVLVWRGRLLLALKAPDEAEQLARAAIALKPRSWRAVALLALAREGQRDPAEALTHWRRIPPGARPARDAQLGIARTLGALDRIEEAEAGLVAADRMFPDDPQLGALRVRLLIRLGRIDAANTVADRLVMVSPEMPEALVARALASEARHSVETALRWCEAAKRVNHRALFKAQLGRLSRSGRKAARQIKRSMPAALPPDADGVEALIARADALFGSKDFARLLPLMNALADADPLRGYYEATVLFHHQCFTEAIERCERLLDHRTEWSVFGETAAARREQVGVLRHRALATTGQVVPAADPQSPALALDLCWRADPATGEELARSLLAARGHSRRSELLLAYLPWLRGDHERARAMLAALLLRNEEAARAPSAELALLGSLLAVEAADTVLQQQFLRAYFDAFALDFPLPCESMPFGFPAFDASGTSGPVGGPLVTTITTAFNAEHTIGYALRSLQQQTHSNLEIIVVDDCSTDRTPALLAEVAAADPRVKVMRSSRNLGTHSCKNIALAVARGAYYTCHDSDDWSHPRRIEQHVALMESDPTLIASSSNWFRMDETGRPALRRWHGRFTHTNPASAFCRIAVRDTIGFYDSVRIEADLEHWQRLMLQYGVDRTARIDRPLAIGLSHAHSLTRAGPGAQDEENYSAVRSAYRMAALSWRREAMRRPTGLYLPQHLARRPFPVPPGVAA